MYTKAILVCAALAVMVQAAPTPQEPTTAPLWYLRSALRVCDNAAVPATCSYKFGIDESNGNVPFQCNYTITAPGAASNGIGAQRTDYQNQKCDGSNQFSINSGWDAQGFSTLVVSDIAANMWAFFGVSDQKFDAGTVNPDPSAQSATVGSFPSSAMRSVQAKYPVLVST